MRIIGGKHGGRRFHPPADKWPTRPTTDYAKEGLFNILQNRLDFEHLKVLDLFGGTGNHSYEFISRGSTDVTYVDKFGGCVAFVKKTALQLQIESELRVVKSDVFKFMKYCGEQFDYIFAGPPYGLSTIDTIPDRVFEHQLLRKAGLFVMEHNPNHGYEDHPNFLESRHYGKTIFSFFQ
ncbi:MAG: RsmD family RNA methyltransferase [Bacteroidota bacterium]